MAKKCEAMAEMFSHKMITQMLRGKDVCQLERVFFFKGSGSNGNGSRWPWASSVS